MRRHIFDSEESKRLPGTFVRTEEGPASQDESVIRSYNGLGIAYQFYKEVFGQNSLDFRGSPLGASIHHDHKLQDAFWNGRQMIFGDGDGIYWKDVTSSLDVIGHELTHGVIPARWHSKLDVTKVSWLLGAELFTAKVQGTGGAPAATRSMKAPGSRYDDPVLRKDLQVDHMAKLWTKEGDHGGEHINSGYSWKTVGVGPFWYYVMTQSGLQPSATFQDFANALMKAAKSFGSSKLQRAMKQAWADVGVDV